MKLITGGRPFKNKIDILRAPRRKYNAKCNGEHHQALLQKN